MKKPSILGIWFLAIRPKTLTAAVVPVVAGTALVQASGFSIQWWISICALFSALLIQIATNLINDFVDFKKGADTAKRLGPTRVTQAGLVSNNQLKMAVAMTLLGAIFFGLPLVIQGGWVICIVGIASLILAYGYTGGPFPLAYKGWGDVFVILFFGVIAVGGVFFLQTGFWTADALILGLQIGLHCAVLIAVNNLRDIEGDTVVHKKTLPVRWGKKFARYEIAALCLMPFLMQIYWLEKKLIWAAILGFLPLPLAVHLIRVIFKTEPSEKYNQFLAKASALHFIFGLMVSFGMVL